MYRGSKMQTPIDVNREQFLLTAIEQVSKTVDSMRDLLEELEVELQLTRSPLSVGAGKA
ncbi:MAG: hypothetical protein ACK5ME_13460 [Parahaliea sp.]